MLSTAVRTHGAKNWVKVQQHVPGRTDVQCRERWVNILNPDLNQGEWSTEEDEKLKKLIEKHGLGKWSTVAAELYPRTDNQVKKIGKFEENSIKIGKFFLDNYYYFFYVLLSKKYIILSLIIIF